jgi:hypothetical protein
MLEETVSKSVFVKKLCNKYAFVRCVSRDWFGLFGNCAYKILCIAVEFNNALMKIMFTFTSSYVTWRGFEPRTLACRKSQVVGFVMYRTLLCLAAVDSIPVSFTLKLWHPPMDQDAQLNKVAAPFFCSLFYRFRNLHCMEFSGISWGIEVNECP